MPPSRQDGFALWRDRCYSQPLWQVAPHPTWGLRKQAGELWAPPIHPAWAAEAGPFIPWTPLQTLFAPIHLWMVTGNPFLAEQTMLENRQKSSPMSRIF